MEWDEVNRNRGAGKKAVRRREEIGERKCREIEKSGREGRENRRSSRTERKGGAEDR